MEAIFRQLVHSVLLSVNLYTSKCFGWLQVPKTHISCIIMHLLCLAEIHSYVPLCRAEALSIPSWSCQLSHFVDNFMSLVLVRTAQ